MHRIRRTGKREQQTAPLALGSCGDGKHRQAGTHPDAIGYHPSRSTSGTTRSAASAGRARPRSSVPVAVARTRILAPPSSNRADRTPRIGSARVGPGSPSRWTNTRRPARGYAPGLRRDRAGDGVVEAVAVDPQPPADRGQGGDLSGGRGNIGNSAIGFGTRGRLRHDGGSQQRRGGREEDTVPVPDRTPPQIPPLASLTPSGIEAPIDGPRLRQRLTVRVPGSCVSRAGWARGGRCCARPARSAHR